MRPTSRRCSAGWRCSPGPCGSTASRRWPTTTTRATCTATSSTARWWCRRATRCGSGCSETIRQYAYDKLRTAGEEAVYRSRRRDWALALAEQAQPALDAGGDTGWHDRLEEELDNLPRRPRMEPGRAQRARGRRPTGGGGQRLWVARRWSAAMLGGERAARWPPSRPRARDGAANLGRRRLRRRPPPAGGQHRPGRELGDDLRWCAKPCTCWATSRGTTVTSPAR